VRKKLVQSNLIVSEFVCCEPRQSTVIHQHPKQDEVFYIIEGTGAIAFEDHEIEVVQGSHIFVPAGTPHGIRTDDDSRLVVMFIKGPGTTGKSAQAS